MKTFEIKTTKKCFLLLATGISCALIGSESITNLPVKAPAPNSLPSLSSLPSYTPPTPQSLKEPVMPVAPSNVKTPSWQPSVDISSQAKMPVVTPATQPPKIFPAEQSKSVAIGTNVQGPFTGDKTVTKVINLNQGHAAPDFKQKIQKFADQTESQLSVMVEGSSVLAKGQEQAVVDLENYINLLDKPVKQIRVDAIILFAQRNYNFDIGIDWSGIYNRAQSVAANGNPFGFVGLGGSLTDIPKPTQPVGGYYTASSGQPSIGTSPDANLFVDPTNFALNLFNKAFTATTAASSGNSFVQIPFVFGGADLNLRRLNLVLNAAETESKVKIVSRPSVLTGDKQTATVNIGQQLPMQQSAINQGTGTVFKSGQVVYKSVGITLKVTPTVGTDNKTITLDVTIGDIQVISGSTQSNNDGIMTNPPVLSDLSVTNTVVLKSGQTTVIGGLATRSDRKTINRVPLLYRVPVLGNLFQASLNSDAELEQFIFITPTIIEENI